MVYISISFKASAVSPIAGKVRISVRVAAYLYRVDMEMKARKARVYVIEVIDGCQQLQDSNE